MVWLDVAYSLIVDLLPHSADRHAAMAKIDEALAVPPWPDREYFGRGTAAQQGQSAMMAAVPGPAPMRDPNAVRPRDARAAAAEARRRARAGAEAHRPQEPVQ